jgi:predicted transcriptional regulator
MSTYVITPTADQEKLFTAFLEEQQISFFKDDETLPDFVLEGIARGQEDIKAGRFITHEEFKKRMKSAK